MPIYAKKHQEKRELVQQLTEQGLTKREISEQSGIPFGSISHYMKMWGLKTKQARAGYEHLKEQGLAMLNDGLAFTSVADALGIPRGSIHYAVNTWLNPKKRRDTHLSVDGKERSKKALKASHARGREHPFRGLVAMNGRFVTKEEFAMKVKELADQDMTYEQMMVELGVNSTATIWKALKENNLLKGKRSGERTHMWRGGHRKYRGPNWQQQRKLALERDSHTCQDCGKTNAQELKERGKQLSVHHLVPYEISYDSSLDNLISLCNSCHMKREYFDGRFTNT